jgi:hypothetical protein
MRSRRLVCLLPNTARIVYDERRATKEIALKTIEQSPENASWEELGSDLRSSQTVRRKDRRRMTDGRERATNVSWPCVI